MRNNDYRKMQKRGSSTSVKSVESDHWGADWIQSCREIRDNDPSADTNKRLSDRKQIHAGNKAESRRVT
jgi:hypothetical protein